MELIIDRTLADVQRVATLRAKGWEGMTADEKAYWLRGDPVWLDALDGHLEALDGQLSCRDGIIKGAYNSVDLNRVETAAAYLSGLLEQYGYLVPYVSRGSEWPLDDIPTQSDTARYLGNVWVLRDGFYGSVPLPTMMDNLTHTQANDIERLLLEIERHIELMILGFWYSGEVLCGEV